MARDDAVVPLPASFSLERRDGRVPLLLDWGVARVPERPGVVRPGVRVPRVRTGVLRVGVLPPLRELAKADTAWAAILICQTGARVRGG